MRIVRITNKFGVDELNNVLDLPVKIEAIAFRGEDLEILFDSDNDALIEVAIDKVIDYLSKYKVVSIREVNDEDKRKFKILTRERRKIRRGL